MVHRPAVIARIFVVCRVKSSKVTSAGCAVHRYVRATRSSDESTAQTVSVRPTVVTRDVEAEAVSMVTLNRATGASCTTTTTAALCEWMLLSAESMMVTVCDTVYSPAPHRLLSSVSGDGGDPVAVVTDKVGEHVPPWTRFDDVTDHSYFVTVTSGCSAGEATSVTSVPGASTLMKPLVAEPKPAVAAVATSGAETPLTTTEGTCHL